MVIRRRKKEKKKEAPTHEGDVEAPEDIYELQMEKRGGGGGGRKEGNLCRSDKFAPKEKIKQRKEADCIRLSYGSEKPSKRGGG